MKNYFYGLLVLLIVGCSVQQKVVQTVPQVQSTPEPIVEKVKVLKRKVAIARFSNETQYAKGVFYDKSNDPLGKQASDILATKLAASDKFILLERQDMDKILEEMKLQGSEGLQKIGADYLIIGSITEYGRKNTGDTHVFSNSKTQTVEAGLNIRLVDVSTGQIIYSEEAKGTAETTTKTVIGLGESADFDATLSDKAISGAISKLVENVINNCMDRPWKSFILSASEDGILISGGVSQGLKVGDVFDVVEAGKKIKNPQTGMFIELPGKKIAKVKIELTGGDTVQNEYSVVSVVEGSIDNSRINKYQIKEIK
ncbi:CsgG/HfaB family protein [Flavicella sediminum]|uniref:CsgG/HfaB family protein n=1 Tax=Flavicella sediminum TaxID=2585141 RepID=UPI00111F9443|nr:CsgG/HfaB family protein [Flavicella sediminum]